MKVDPRNATYLACCLLMRGKMTIADMNRNVASLKPKLNIVHWNSDGFKLGICSTPPVGRVINLCLCCMSGHQSKWSMIGGVLQHTTLHVSATHVAQCLILLSHEKR